MKLTIAMICKCRTWRSLAMTSFGPLSERAHRPSPECKTVPQFHLPPRRVGGWLGDQESGCGQSRNRRQTQQRVCCAPPNEISAGNQTRLHKIIPHALSQFGQIKFQAGASNEIKFAPYGRNYSRKSYYSSFGLNMFRLR